MNPTFRLLGNRAVTMTILIICFFSYLLSFFPTSQAFAATDNSVTIYYKQGFTTPYFHYKQSSGAWTTAPGTKMIPSEVSGYSKLTISIGTATTLIGCFNDGTTQWDSRNGQNYTFNVGTSTVNNGVITTGFPTGGLTPTPAITALPTATITPTSTPSNSNVVSATFIIDKCLTSFGQSCWIVGDFSNWTTTGAIKLTSGTTGYVYPKWIGSKSFAQGKAITFKTVVAPDNGGTIVSWEGGNNRSVTVDTIKTYESAWGSSIIQIASGSTPTIAPTPTPVITATPAITATAAPTPTPGYQQVIIYYKATKATNIHYKIDNSTWTTSPGIPMNASEYFGYQQMSYTSTNSFTMTAAFNDGTTWDNKKGANYTFSPGVFTVENGIVRTGLPFTGGNIVTIYYPHVLYDYGKRYQFEYVHFRPDGSTSWTVLPGVSMTYKANDTTNFSRADLHIGAAAKVADLAIQVRDYGGSTWINNNGLNYHDLTPGTYVLYAGKLLKTNNPDELPATAIGLLEAHRGVGHGCYDQCAYLNGTLRVVPLGTTQKVYVNYQIPSGAWKTVDATPSLEKTLLNQNYTFATSAMYMESPVQFYYQYIVDGQMIYQSEMIDAQSATILGETKITADCGIGFGSNCGYNTGTTFQAGIVVNKNWNNGVAPTVEVVYVIDNKTNNPQVVTATANGTSSLNGALASNYEAYTYSIPIVTGKITSYYFRTTMGGTAYTTNSNGTWYHVQ